jgi:hypothetical protein
MDGYLAKPVAIDRLSAVLGRWIALPAPAVRPRAVVDRAMLRTWLGEDKANVQSLLAEFLASARRHAQQLETALTMADTEAAVIAAHNLKGSASSVGAHVLARVAGELEALARSGDHAACRNMQAPLARELERVAEDIEGQSVIA